MGNCLKEEESEMGPVTEMRVINYTWRREYQGLFDYESKAVDTQSFRVKGNVIITKDEGQHEIIAGTESLAPHHIRHSLFRIDHKRHYFQITPISFESEDCYIQKLMWLVVSSLPRKHHVIQEGDVIKLGKQRLNIREIVHLHSNAPTDLATCQLSKTIYEDLADKNKICKSKEELELGTMLENGSQQTTSEPICRICLDPGEYSNPLITPCKCIGSVKYIHLNCLKCWLSKQLKVSHSSHCITINWRTLNCEMCRAGFKYRVYMDGKKFYTVDIPKPPKPYITIELMKKSASAKQKVFHFISFAQKTRMSLGRRKNIDVRISSNASLSREHAVIEYVSDLKEFRLSDHQSKFGTLILIKRGIMIKPILPKISLQVESEVYSLEALRGPGDQSQEPDEAKNSEYMIDCSSDEDDDVIEEGSDDQSQGRQEQEESSPLLYLENAQLSQPPENPV